MYDAAIYSDALVTPDGITDATVVVNNGVITDIVRGKLDNAMDAAGKMIMPGIVDPHVHINEPGRTEWEGFNTGTRAAIAGGITTLVEMPLNASPVTTTVQAFEEKLVAAQSNLHCNCGFWGGIIPGNERDIEPLIARGVLGFKAFLVDSGIDEFPNVTEADLRTAMPIIARHGLPLLVHCELSGPAPPTVVSQPRAYQEYLLSRPREWEDRAIAMMIRLCEEFNCRVHIVHLSSSNSIEQIARAKERGLPLTAETCQHYLYFNAEEIANGATQFKCAPPIREKENNEKLWQALKQGVIDFVATDHSPATPDLKELKSGDFSKAWGGIASLQFALPALWTAALKHDCQPAEMATWLSQNPSKLPGLDNHKGRIQKGYDADLVVWDPDQTFEVTSDIIQHKHKVTPYAGEQLHGVVEQTWLAGKLVYDRGNFLDLKQGKIILHG